VKKVVHFLTISGVCKHFFLAGKRQDKCGCNHWDNRSKECDESRCPVWSKIPDGKRA